MTDEQSEKPKKSSVEYNRVSILNIYFNAFLTKITFHKHSAYSLYNLMEVV
jgi:hypothetical protein